MSFITIFTLCMNAVNERNVSAVRALSVFGDWELEKKRNYLDRSYSWDADGDWARPEIPRLLLPHSQNPATGSYHEAKNMQFLVAFRSGPASWPYPELDVYEGSP